MLLKENDEKILGQNVNVAMEADLVDLKTQLASILINFFSPKY